MQCKYLAAPIAILLLTLAFTAAPAMADPAQETLLPVWELTNDDGYLFLDTRPGCDRLYVLTFANEIQAVDSSGTLLWTADPQMSWPDLDFTPAGGNSAGSRNNWTNLA